MKLSREQLERLLNMMKEQNAEEILFDAVGYEVEGVEVYINGEEIAHDYYNGVWFVGDE